MNKEKNSVPSTGNLDFSDCFVYIFLTLISQRLSHAAVAIINSLLKNTFQISWSVRNAIIYPIYIIVPHILFLSFASRFVTKHYVKSDNRFLWLKKGLCFTLPGEIARLCICATTVNVVYHRPWKFGIAYAPIVHLMFTNTYGAWSGRYYEISAFDSVGITYIAWDYIAYIICHLIYLIPYMTLTMLIYYMMWKVAAKENEDIRSGTK